MLDHADYIIPTGQHAMPYISCLEHLDHEVGSDGLDAELSG